MYVITTMLNGTRVRLFVGCLGMAEDTLDRLTDHGLYGLMSRVDTLPERGGEERLRAEQLMAMLMAPLNQPLQSGHAAPAH